MSWKQIDPKVVPNYPHLLVFMPLCMALPLRVDRTCDLLLTNRIKQRWWHVQDYSYRIVLHETVISVLQGGSLPWWLWRNKLLCCKLPYGGDHVTRSSGQPVAKRNWSLQSSSLQELNVAHNHINLKADPSAVELNGETTTLADTLLAACETLRQRTQLSHVGTQDPQKLRP